jgi:hypothetical protein
MSELERRAAVDAGRHRLTTRRDRHPGRLSLPVVEVDEMGGERMPRVIHDFPVRPHVLDRRSVLVADDAFDASADVIQLVDRISAVLSLGHGPNHRYGSVAVMVGSRTPGTSWPFVSRWHAMWPERAPRGPLPDGMAIHAV